jgi:hypothetical protein
MNYLRLFLAGFGVAQSVRLIAYGEDTVSVGLGILLVPIFVTYGYLAKEKLSNTGKESGNGSNGSNNL